MRAHKIKSMNMSSQFFIAVTLLLLLLFSLMVCSVVYLVVDGRTITFWTARYCRRTLSWSGIDMASRRTRYSASWSISCFLRWRYVPPQIISLFSFVWRISVRWCIFADVECINEHLRDRLVMQSRSFVFLGENLVTGPGVFPWKGMGSIHQSSNFSRNHFVPSRRNMDLLLAFRQIM